MTPTPKRQVTTLRLEAALTDGLRRIKARDGIPASEQIRRAVIAWLADRDPGPAITRHPRQKGRR